MLSNLQNGQNVIPPENESVTTVDNPFTVRLDQNMDLRSRFELWRLVHDLLRPILDLYLIITHSNGMIPFYFFTIIIDLFPQFVSKADSNKILLFWYKLWFLT